MCQTTLYDEAEGLCVLCCVMLCLGLQCFFFWFCHIECLFQSAAAEKGNKSPTYEELMALYKQGKLPSLNSSTGCALLV